MPEEKEVEEVEEVKEVKEEKEEKTTLPTRDRTFKEVEIFRFGSEARQVDIGVKDGDKKDINVSRWVGITAPFPIPDPDDNEIKYPSIEHYMAAMKLAHTSNSPDLAITLMSTSGSIHQKYSLERRQKQIKAGSESTKDYELLDKEVDDIKKAMTKQYLNRFKVTFDENKWNRPLIATDPLSFRDRVLMDALIYRWENDDRFRRIVEAAREQKKYLLYSIGPKSSESELAGAREMTGPQKGKIKGGNKVGIFIMQIAAFQ